MALDVGVGLIIGSISLRIAEDVAAFVVLVGLIVGSIVLSITGYVVFGLILRCVLSENIVSNRTVL